MVALAENKILKSGGRCNADAETQNYYVRNRYYLPTLGRWLTRDPIGYQGGINLYAYVQSSPVGNVDGEGLAWFTLTEGGYTYTSTGNAATSTLGPPEPLAEQQDVAVLENELNSFRNSGYTMAAALLAGFLGNGNGANYPGGSTNAFNTPAFQNEVKGSKDHREYAMNYLQNYVKTRVAANRSAFPDGHTVAINPPSKGLYFQFYFDIGYGDSSVLANDLMYAFGGLVFKFHGKIDVTRCGNHVEWATKGLEVKTDDKYAFPNYEHVHHAGLLAGLKEFAANLSPAFRAGYALQHQFGFKPFFHPLNWADQFGGKFSLSLPSDWGDGTWVIP